MQHIDDFLKKLEKSLKEFNTTEELVKLGVFSSSGQAGSLRCRGRAPKFIKMGRTRYFYPKHCILEWIKEMNQYGESSPPKSEKELFAELRKLTPTTNIKTNPEKFYERFSNA